MNEDYADKLLWEHLITLLAATLGTPRFPDYVHQEYAGNR